MYHVRGLPVLEGTHQPIDQPHRSRDNLLPFHWIPPARLYLFVHLSWAQAWRWMLLVNSIASHPDLLAAWGGTRCSCPVKMRAIYLLCIFAIWCCCNRQDRRQEPKTRNFAIKYLLPSGCLPLQVSFGSNTVRRWQKCNLCHTWSHLGRSVSGAGMLAKWKEVCRLEKKTRGARGCIELSFVKISFVSPLLLCTLSTWNPWIKPITTTVRTNDDGGRGRWPMWKVSSYHFRVFVY